MEPQTPTKGMVEGVPTVFYEVDGDMRRYEVKQGVLSSWEHQTWIR